MLTRFFSVFTKFKALKRHGRLMFHAFRHAETPKWIKGVMLGVVAYLFMPIDIIPDFLVFFGITDDLVVISAAMWFLGKAIPEKVINSLPLEPAQAAPAPQRKLQIAGWVLVAVLVLLAVLNSLGFQIQNAF